MEMDQDPYSFQDVDEQMQDNMLYWTFSPGPFAFMNSGGTTTTTTTYNNSPMSTVSASSNDQRYLMRRGFIEYSNYVSTRDSATAAATTIWADPKSSSSSSSSSFHRNIHRRMIEYLRTMPAIPASSSPKPEIIMKNQKVDVDINNGSRLFRHMMRERLRREKMSQSYADLYSMLLPTSKADKKSIVQSATVHLKELNKVKEELHMRNKELRERIDQMIMVRPEAEAEAEAEAGAKIIRVRLMNPTSTIDSMIGALQCVKGMGAMATTIHSHFSGEEFTALMTIQTKIERSEVEKAVEKTLMETERKLRLQQVLRSGGWAHQNFQQDQLNVEN